MKRFHSNDLSLAFHDVGHGEPVVLLHGFPLHSASFAGQLTAPTLTAGHRLLVPDLRGFGQSLPSRPGVGPVEMRTFAEDLLAWLDHLGLASVWLGGVSMGGYIAMAVLQLAPSRVKGLLLIDTHPDPDDDAGRARREETARNIEAQGMGFLADSMLPKLLAPTAPAEVRARLRQLILENNIAGAAAATRGMALRDDSKPVLSRFAGPALVVVGEDDALIPVEKARALASLLPHGELRVLPGAGHLPPLETPDAFNGALADFLERHATPR